MTEPTKCTRCGTERCRANVKVHKDDKNLILADIACSQRAIVALLHRLVTEDRRYGGMP